MFLYFLRHASAGQQLSTAKKDEKRGLDKDGIEQCGYIGRALAALGVQVEIIVASPLKRSTQTAALVAKVEMRRNSGSLSWCITPRILRALHAAATESSRPKTSRK